MDEGFTAAPRSDRDHRDRAGYHATSNLQGDEAEYSFDPDTPILANAPGEISLLEPRATVFLVGTKKPNTTITSARLSAVEIGVTSPMWYSCCITNPSGKYIT